MTSRLDLPSLLELILRSAAEMVGCPAGMILLQPQAPPLDSPIRVAPRFQVPRFITSRLSRCEPLPTPRRDNPGGFA